MIDRPDSSAPLGRRAIRVLLRIPLLIVLIAAASESRGDASVHAYGAGELEAARVLQAKGQWAASDSIASAALERLEREPTADSLEIATALYLQSRARWNTVGYGDGTALRAATRCLGIRTRRLGGDHLEVAEVHQLVANLLLGGDRADSALVHIRRAIEIRAARLAPDDTLLAVSWDALALIHRSRQDFHAALDAWTRAIEVRRRADGPESPGVAALIGQTGLCYSQFGDFDRARQLFHESLDMFARTRPDDPQRWIPLSLLADLERTTGNLALDVDLLQEALRVVRLNYGEGSRRALTIRFNLGVALIDFGDYQGAREIFSALLPLMRAQFGPTHPRALWTELSLATACAGTGDTANALRGFRDVETAMVARPGPTDPNLSTAQFSQGDLLRQQGRYPESLALIERAILTDRLRPGARSRGKTTPNAYFNMILTLGAMGDTAALDSTRLELFRVYETSILRSTNTAAALQYYLAYAARALGLGDEAWTRALEGERLSRERLRLNVRAMADRRALEITKKQGGYLELVLELSRGGDGTRPEAAWDRLVRSRGLVGADLVRRRPPPGYDSDSAVAGAHGRWAEAQRALAQRLVSTSQSNQDSLARSAIERLRASADYAEAVYVGVLKRRGIELEPPDVGLAGIRAHLRQGQALVAFFESRGDLPDVFSCTSCRDSSSVVAFVARGGDDAIDRIELGRSADLLAAIDPWRERLGAPPDSAVRRARTAERECRRLGSAVRVRTWDRIADRIAGASEVFIVGDGPLLDFPWQALPDGSRAYLVETGPRLCLLNAERDLVEPAAVSSGSLLALGGPNYDRSVSEAPWRSTLVAASVRSAPDPCAGGASTRLEPLPGAGAEASEVAREWRANPGHTADVLLGRDATEQAFKREAPGRAMLHLATHGVVARDTCSGADRGTRGMGGVASLEGHPAGPRPIRPTAPEHAPVPMPSPWMGRRVWLALAGANRAGEHTEDENEGFLTSEEVVTLDLAGTDWVVLSACHSGLAERWSREGTLGMRRAFHIAGARSVIASQWAIDDAATGEWMAALYAARAAGRIGAAAAANSASRTVLTARRRSGRSTHPFYWAAFTTSGN